MGRTLPRETVVLPNPSGLHARPAADFAKAAGTHASTVMVSKGDKTANGKSVLSLLALDCRQGDQITIETDGAGAQAALDELVRMIQDGLGEREQYPGSQSRQ